MMSLAAEDIGVGLIRAWIEQRFPGANYQYLGSNFSDDVHRFIIDIGEGFRLACTRKALVHEDVLREQLANLDSMGYLRDLDDELWLLLTADGVVVKDRSSWHA